METFPELGENLVEHSLNISSSVGRRFHPRSPDSISLIDEENRRRGLSCKFEDFFDVLRRLAQPLRYYLVALYLQKAGLLTPLPNRSRNRFCHVGLTGSRRTEQ